MKTTGEVQNGWRCRCLIDITMRRWKFSRIAAEQNCRGQAQLTDLSETIILRLPACLLPHLWPTLPCLVWCGPSSDVSTQVTFVVFNSNL